MDEGKTPVSRVLKTEGDSMIYKYDFGDDWKHEIMNHEKNLDIPEPGKPRRGAVLVGFGSG